MAAKRSPAWLRSTLRMFSDQCGMSLLVISAHTDENGSIILQQ